MGRVISFINPSKGVGKTATCVNLAATLAARGKRVLAVDSAPNARATAWLGVRDVQRSVYDILAEDEDAEACFCRTASGVELLPADTRLSDAEQALIYRRDRESALKQTLGGMRGAFDFILIDCPSSVGLLTVNALTASDGYIVPVCAERFEEDSLALLVNTAMLVRRHLNKDLRMEGALLTMYDMRAAAARHASNEAEHAFGKCVYATVIPRSTRLAESSEGGMPATLYDAKCLGARAYETFCEEFLRRSERGD